MIGIGHKRPIKLSRRLGVLTIAVAASAGILVALSGKASATTVQGGFPTPGHCESLNIVTGSNPNTGAAVESERTCNTVSFEYRAWVVCHDDFSGYNDEVYGSWVDDPRRGLQLSGAVCNQRSTPKVGGYDNDALGLASHSLFATANWQPTIGHGGCP